MNTRLWNMGPGLASVARAPEWQRAARRRPAGRTRPGGFARPQSCPRRANRM